MENIKQLNNKLNIVYAAEKKGYGKNGQAPFCYFSAITTIKNMIYYAIKD